MPDLLIDQSTKEEWMMLAKLIIIAAAVAPLIPEIVKLVDAIKSRPVPPPRRRVN